MSIQLNGLHLSDINLQISSLEASLKFYTEVLGLKVIKLDGKSVKLSATGKSPAQITLIFNEGAIEKPYKTTGLYHVAIRLPNRLELAKTLKHLLKYQWPLYGLSDHTVSEAIYLCDPDEVGIEIYADKDPTADYSNNLSLAMATTTLMANELLVELEDKVYCWEGIHPSTDIGHIHLQVSDLQRSKSFYSDVLGFKVTQERYPGAVFLAAGGYHHHIAINTWGCEGASHPPVNSVGLKSYSIMIKAKDTIYAIANKLKELDYDFEVTEYDNDITLQLLDPDENLLRIKT
ncbi:VOC family protein [Alkaliphilus serpentinus]|uniref:Glyoxalase n=1 Tax=Alkaliphilus serpentinus TaxID=1482731 RepID=A0A833HQ32_9FIRM|nr:VOC family protein [Alkaliphilus serpentinus]KAB3531494.1 glyoxalase [Alkaliphilus serpentinus]